MAKQKTDEKRGPMGWLMICGIVVLASVVVWFFYPKQVTANTAQRYYTDDDGATWFADDQHKIPPFMHNGKEAVLARVYQTENGKPFVAYLEKYTDEAKAKIDSAVSAATPAKPGPHSSKVGTPGSGLLVKKPHGGSWVPEEDPTAGDIKMVTSPDGGTNVMPLTPD